MTRKLVPGTGVECGTVVSNGRESDHSIPIRALSGIDGNASIPPATTEGPIPGPLGRGAFDALERAFRAMVNPPHRPTTGPFAQAILDPTGELFGARRASVARALWDGAAVRIEGACWVSTRADRGVGYACIKIGGTVYDAHRIAHLLANGPIPPKMLVRHSCDVRRCINPAHLSVGTYQDNHDDMVKRGRRASPAVHARAGIARRDAGRVAGQKLDREKVERIRAEWAKGGYTHKSLADRFEVGRASIGRIVRGEQWTEDPPTFGAVLDAAADPSRAS